MKKLLACLIVLVIGVYVVWPFAYVYRLDNAITRGDDATLARLVDLASVRQAIERSVSRDLDTALGAENDGLVGWIKVQANELGAAAVDEVITLQWVADTLQPGSTSFRSRVTHQFFESWDVFVVRVGHLGNDPVHVVLQLTGGNWRVVAVYP